MQKKHVCANPKLFNMLALVTQRYQKLTANEITNLTSLNILHNNCETCLRYFFKLQLLKYLEPSPFFYNLAPSLISQTAPQKHSQIDKTLVRLTDNLRHLTLSSHF